MAERKVSNIEISKKSVSIIEILERYVFKVDVYKNQS